MDRKGRKGVSLNAPVRSQPLVVLVCRSETEAEHVGALVGGIGVGSLVTYRKVEDLALNPPRRRATLVILTGLRSHAAVARALQWLNRYWPRCSSVVISCASDQEMEKVARGGGAMYFVRPVSDGEWRDMLEYAVAEAAERAGRKR